MAYNDRTNNRDNNKDKVVQLPAGYTDAIRSGYYVKDKNGKKVIKKELLVDYAEECAKVFRSTKMAYSQLRSFFDRVQRVLVKMESKVYTVDQAVADMTELIPVAEYKRKSDLCPLCFKTFLEVNINNIKGSDDIRAFARHFMCVTCFMADDKTKKNKNNR